MYESTCGSLSVLLTCFGWGMGKEEAEGKHGREKELTNLIFLLDFLVFVCKLLVMG